jgi:transcriptional regulator with XRE-family HTH domain
MLTTREAAHHAGVSIDVVTAWRVRGILPATNVDGRWAFTPADLDAALERLRVGDVLPRWRVDPQRAGARVRALQEGTGLTQRDVERASGLHRDHVSVLECGRWTPRGTTIHRLAEALGVAPELFVRDDPIAETVYLSTRETATALGVPPIRLRLWLAAGKLPGRKVGNPPAIPQQSVHDLERRGRLQGVSRRLDPRQRGRGTRRPVHWLRV